MSENHVSFRAEHEDFISPGLGSRRNTLEGTTWESLNLLSLDGGGIRGYWTLKVLEQLMIYIGEAEEKLAERNSQDRDRNEKEGLHSFWPNQYPSNVTHVPRERKKEDDEDYDQDERDAGFGNAGEIKKWQASRRYLPCHYFDYICGASTGGLIAIMLGRFRMTVKDCLEEYRTLGNRVFGDPRSVHKMKPIPGIIPVDKYSADNLKRVFQDFTYRRAEKRDKHSGPVTFPTKPGVCKAFVATLKSNPDGTSGDLFLIRSYRHPPEKKPLSNDRVTNYGEAQNFEIWQVARAATAAPTIFKPLKIKHQPVSVEADFNEYSVFSDGGFALTNNPCQEGYEEIRALHLHEGHNGAKVALVVSIGTAKVPRRFGSSVIDTAKWSVDAATNVDKVDKDMRKNSKDGNYHYYRFNTTKADGCNVQLDEWEPRGLMAKLKKQIPGSKTLATIDENFRKWFQKDAKSDEKSNKELLRECAERLVRLRRARVKEEGRWDRYATVSHYYCDRVNCEAEFQYRELFEEHLRTHDQIDGSRSRGKAKVYREDQVAICQKQWEYPGKLEEGKGRY